MKYEITPTIIAKDHEELNSVISEIRDYSDNIHLDIMDGIFVRNKSLDFEFVLPPKKLYEAHLMVEEPDLWVKRHLNNLDTIIANFERIKDPYKLIDAVKRGRQKIGFALNPETSVFDVLPYTYHLDLILIMAVNPGQYGAKFMPGICNKIFDLRTFYDGDIEVDGGMNPETIKLCKDMGANKFAVGSYIQNSPDKAAAIKHLESILGE